MDTRYILLLYSQDTTAVTTTTITTTTKGYLNVSHSAVEIDVTDHGCQKTLN